MPGAFKLALLVGALGVGGVLAAQGAGPAMLAKLQRGQWTVTPDDGSPARRICLGSPQQLVQYRHGTRTACSRLVEEDQPGRVTVQYTCPGNGYGRTTIRRETDTLLQLESQGVAGGRPFQFRAEARRTGTCR
jgi:hypothetical protein